MLMSYCFYEISNCMFNSGTCKNTHTHSHSVNDVDEDVAVQFIYLIVQLLWLFNFFLLLMKLLFEINKRWIIISEYGCWELEKKIKKYKKSYKKGRVYASLLQMMDEIYYVKVVGFLWLIFFRILNMFISKV